MYASNVSYYKYILILYHTGNAHYYVYIPLQIAGKVKFALSSPHFS